MNKRIEFKSKKSIEELKNETLSYFQVQGFKLTNENAKFLQFERGSILKNMVTFNPLKWKSTTKISFEQNKVIAHFDINTVHQTVILKEEKMWDDFISNYQKTIKTGKSFISENKAQLKKTKKSQWEYMGYIILGAIILAILSEIIASLMRKVL